MSSLYEKLEVSYRFATGTSTRYFVCWVVAFARAPELFPCCPIAPSVAPSLRHAPIFALLPHVAPPGSAPDLIHARTVSTSDSPTNRCCPVSRSRRACSRRSCANSADALDWKAWSRLCEGVRGTVKQRLSDWGIRGRGSAVANSVYCHTTNVTQPTTATQPLPHNHSPYCTWQPRQTGRT